MKDRIAGKFQELAKVKRKALITFIMGGDPDGETCGSILEQLPKSGADIIEIGMPFSDPMADGPVIQAAALRALHAGTKLRDLLAVVKTFRLKDNETPIILMGYYNLVYRYGVEQFCGDAANVGVDGVILVDLPPEEENEFTQAAVPRGLHLIRLVAPTTDDARLEKVIKHAGGFLYYISVAGITGTKSADMESLKTRVLHIKTQTSLPIAVGFGIRTPEQIATISAFCDAVVVGSALVEVINKHPEKTAYFVKDLSNALNMY